METEDKDRVLNYEGLYIFLEELKKYFIANPDERGVGRYLRCVNAIDGTVEWAEFPALLTFKGTVASYSQLPTTDNSPGDVWKVESTGAEYVWILNLAGTSYIWEYIGELVSLTTHAGITDTATAGQVLVSKSNGAGGITYEWVTLTNSDTTYTFSQSGNTLTITPSSGSASTYTPTFTDTDRYVNSASFADDSTNNSSSPVKMTLTRAGSDSATVTANLPKVSSSTAGVVAKGASVSTLSLTTKFLREDGEWAAPSYTTDTNTTYSFAEGSTDGAFQVTSSGGSATSVSVHNVLKLSGGTLTGPVYDTMHTASLSTSSGYPTIYVYYFWKYNKFEVTDQDNISTLYVRPAGITDPTYTNYLFGGPCEMIFIIKNSMASNDLTVSLPSNHNNVTLHNMLGSSSLTVPAGKVAEVIFTYWSVDTINGTAEGSFNGGLEL